MAGNPLNDAAMQAGSPGGAGSYSQFMDRVGQAAMAANGRQWSAADDAAASARYQQRAADPQHQAIIQQQGNQALQSAKFAQFSPPSQRRAADAMISHVHSFGGKGGGQ